MVKKEKEVVRKDYYVECDFCGARSDKREDPSVHHKCKICEKDLCINCGTVYWFRIIGGGFYSNDNEVYWALCPDHKDISLDEFMKKVGKKLKPVANNSWIFMTEEDEEW
jgi:hypothetical protein